MKVADFDYNLPEELIAQSPAEKRDHSKLMVVDRKTGEISHEHFYNVIEHLGQGDCLVLNNSKVIPARIFGKKEATGANIEFLLIKKIKGDVWQSMVRPGKKVKPGDVIIFADNLKCKVLDYGDDGTRIVEFIYDGIFMERLEEVGSMPLPPYIERKSTDTDNERYQTVYCKNEGSVAAPTAGLHFTDEILEAVKAKGIKVCYVTLHVGIGTFRPVKVDVVEEHVMHFEEYEVPEASAAMINETIDAGGRVVAVGTTSVRTLESAACLSEEDNYKYKVKAGFGETSIFIYPGYEFKIVGSLITNYHLPKSTLIMLISAFYSKEGVMRAYEEAISKEYMFFSYGDSMFLV